LNLYGTLNALSNFYQYHYLFLAVLGLIFCPFNFLISSLIEVEPYSVLSDPEMEFAINPELLEVLLTLTLLLNESILNPAVTGLLSTVADLKSL